MTKSPSHEARFSAFMKLAEKHKIGIEFHPENEVQVIDPEFDMIFTIKDANLAKFRRVLAAILTNREYAD
ncbi:hypothetical protein [Vibrio phage VCPH]|nr:hypothetical protein [Vibrio phage VCPH]